MLVMDQQLELKVKITDLQEFKQFITDLADIAKDAPPSIRERIADAVAKLAKDASAIDA